MARGQSFIKYSPTYLVVIAHIECGGRALVGTFVLRSTLASRISLCTRAGDIVYDPASRHCVSRVSRSRGCVRAVPNMVSNRHIARFRLRLAIDNQISAQAVLRQFTSICKV